ncbi:MAG: hypothetical protein ACK4RK_15235, partial [Gemmataceae bacterium]
MSTPTQSPSIQSLRRLLIGQVSDSEAEQLEAYLAQCSEEELAQLDLDSGEDWLISAMKRLAGKPPPLPPDILADLLDRVCHLKPCSPRPTPSRAVTADAVPNLSAAGFDFLAPAQA